MPVALQVNSAPEASTPLVAVIGTLGSAVKFHAATVSGSAANAAGIEKMLSTIITARSIAVFFFKLDKRIDIFLPPVPRIDFLALIILITILINESICNDDVKYHKR